MACRKQHAQHCGANTCLNGLGPCPRSERLAKYNQLMRIEEELGKNAVYAGKSWAGKVRCHAGCSEKKNLPYSMDPDCASHLHQ